MNSETFIPVILLVYANDRIDPKNHLRNLSEEIACIRNALQTAEQAGLCKVLFEPNATANTVMSVFKNNRDRIAIFHYAGHANGYQLLLESESGEHGTADADGLATFLGEQRALELVFLNGCSTEQQAQGLLNANCSSVIATSQAIDDQVAMNFASHFYQSLGSGASIERSYNEAVAAIKTQKGNDFRALYWGDATTVATLSNRFPWELKIKQGAESVRRWNLPDAADDPLFGLPKLPKLDIPESPFRHIYRFEREHAEIFFGRGFQIRELFQAVTTEDTAPIILFYGQSGVGKSSVLDAGLLPRLEETHLVHYLRRDQSKGLLGTLLTVFDNTETDLGVAWHNAEREQNRPMLVVLDQVEEVFTLPNKEQPDEVEEQSDEVEEQPDEVEEQSDEVGEQPGEVEEQSDEVEEQPGELAIFIESLLKIFGQPMQRPRGKLILGFRKEWLPEIVYLLRQQHLPYYSLFLNIMDRRGVIEAISEPADSERLKTHFKLEIDDGLAKRIANDLLSDNESPIAPTLQILLSKLWEQAKKENYEHPCFTSDGYKTLRKEGILLGDFLKQQLDVLEQWRPEVVQSGLVLDVLAYHTTSKGTAAQCTQKELKIRYQHNIDIVESLVEECKKGYLLADIPSTQFDPIKGTRLAHDTLAPLVRERFDESDLPGQRALRIVVYRAVDWEDGKTGTVLDDADLTVVEAGATGMRDWNTEEQYLMLVSCKERDRRKRNRRILNSLAVSAMVIIVGLLIFATWQWKVANEKTVEAEARTEEVFTASLAAQSQALLAESTDNSRLSALLAVDAISRYKKLGQRSIPAEKALRNALRLLPSLLHSFNKNEVDDFDFTPNSKYLVIASKDGIRVLTTKNFVELTRFPYNNKPTEISTPRYLDPDKSEKPFLRAFDNYIILLTENAVEIHDIKTGNILLERKNISLASVSKQGNFVAWYNQVSAKIEIWFNKSSQEISEIPTQAKPSAIFFSPAENYLAVEHTDGGLQTWWKLSDGKVNQATNPKIVNKATQQSIMEPSGVKAGSALDWHYLLIKSETETDNGLETLWHVVDPLTGKSEFDLPTKSTSGEFKQLFFTPDGRLLFTWHEESEMQVWKTSDWKQVFKSKGQGFNRSIDYVTFDPTGTVYLEYYVGSRLAFNRIDYIDTDEFNDINPSRLKYIERSGINELNETFSADGSFVAISELSRVHVFSTTSGLEIASEAFNKEKHASFLSLSPNGRFLIIGEASNNSSEDHIPNILKLFLIEPDSIHATEDEKAGQSSNGCETHLPYEYEKEEIDQENTDFDQHYKKVEGRDGQNDYLKIAKIIERSTGKLVWEFPTNGFNPESIPFVSPKGHFFGLLNKDENAEGIPVKVEMRIWDTQIQEAEKWKEISQWKEDGLEPPSFSPDEKFFTIKTFNGVFKIVSSSVEDKLPDGSPSEILIFSTNELASLFSNHDWLLPRFTNDSRYLMLGEQISTNSSPKCFPLYPEEMIINACKRIGRNLSHEEWKKYFGDKPEKPICDIPPDSGIGSVSQPESG